MLTTSSPSWWTRDVEGEPVVGGVAAVDDRLDRGVDVVDLGLGEEADVPEVDPEHRRPAGVGDLGRAQDRAVAADDDGELAAVPGVGLALGELQPEVALVLGQVEVGRLLGQQPHHEPVAAQRVHELARHVARLAAARVGEQQHPARAVGPGHGVSHASHLGTTADGARPHTGSDHGVAIGLRRASPGPAAATGRTRRCRTDPAAGSASPAAHPSRVRRRRRRRWRPPRPTAPGRAPRRPCRPGPCRPRTAASPSARGRRRRR